MEAPYLRKLMDAFIVKLNAIHPLQPFDENRIQQNSEDIWKQL